MAYEAEIVSFRVTETRGMIVLELICARDAAAVHEGTFDTLIVRTHPQNGARMASEINKLLGD